MDKETEIKIESKIKTQDQSLAVFRNVAMERDEHDPHPPPPPRPTWPQHGVKPDCTAEFPPVASKTSNCRANETTSNHSKRLSRRLTKPATQPACTNNTALPTNPTTTPTCFSPVEKVHWISSCFLNAGSSSVLPDLTDRSCRCGRGARRRLEGRVRVRRSDE